MRNKPKSVGLRDISVEVGGQPLTGSPWRVFFFFFFFFFFLTITHVTYRKLTVKKKNEINVHSDLK